MPFTPYHMGPGLLAKALLRGSFSLLVFGWTQVLMDVEPLVVMLIGRGRVHGVSHTYLAALPIALLAAVTGKGLAQSALRLGARGAAVTLPWWVALTSALIGSVSHVALDSVIYRDMRPFDPLSPANPLLGLVSVSDVHAISVVAGVVGVAVLALRLSGSRRHRP